MVVCDFKDWVLKHTMASRVSSLYVSSLYWITHSG